MPPPHEPHKLCCDIPIPFPFPPGCCCQVRGVPPSEAKVFNEYVLPSLSLLPSEAELAVQVGVCDVDVCGDGVWGGEVGAWTDGDVWKWVARASLRRAGVPDRWPLSAPPVMRLL